MTNATTTTATHAIKGTAPNATPTAAPITDMPSTRTHAAATPAPAKPAPCLATSALAVPRSGIRDVFDRAERVPDCISLAVGEPGETAAAHIVEAGCRAIREGDTHYTNVLGTGAYREAAANYTRRVKGLDYDPAGEIQAIDGATIGLYLALKAVVDPGDEVLIPSPYFTSYDAEVMLCGGIVRTVPLRPEHGMRLDARDIEAAIGPRTRAIILNSPGNPTGAVTPMDELERIGRVLERHNVWAISDEVYHPFVFGDEDLHSPDCLGSTAPSIAAAPGMKERTIVVESLSKTFAMTGWRIGYLLAPEAVIEQTSKIAELMHSSVNSIALAAGTAALDGPMDRVIAMKHHYARNRTAVLEALSGCATLRPITPEGAFYVFVDVRGTGLDDVAFCHRLLDEESVAAVPGSAFGQAGAGFVRLSYAGDAADVREGARRMRAFAERL